MVISAPTLLTAGGSGTDALAYDTALISPDAGALLVLFVDSGAATSGENDIPTISDTLGFTWTLRDTATGYDGVYLRGNFFTAPVPTGGDSGSIHISFAHLQSSCHWHVIQVVGANTAGPVVQVGHALFNTSTNPSFNLPSVPVSSSLVLAADIRNGTTAYGAGTGHTLLSSLAGNSNPAVGSDVTYDMAPAGQAINFVTASAAQKTLFGIEIAVGGTVPPPPTPAEASLVRKWKQQETVATNTFPLTVPHDLEIGETLVISVNRVTGATPGAITGVTGIGTNVATVAAESIRASTMVVDTIVIPITQKILSGAVITIGIASGSPSRKAAVCSVWAGLTGAVNASSGTSAGPNGSGTAATASTTAAASLVPTLVIGSYGHGATQVVTPSGTSTVVDTISTAAGTTDRAVTQTSRVDTAAGVKTASADLAATGGWAETVIALPVASAAPGAPVANAGGDQIDKEPGEALHLSADASTAAGTMAFVWTQLSGEPVNFTTSGPDLYITEAPWTIAGTTLVFRVSVTYAGMTSTDDVQIVVLPASDRIKIGSVEVALKIVQA